VTFISTLSGWVITNKLTGAKTTQGWPTTATLQRLSVDKNGVAVQRVQGLLQPLVPGGTTTAGAQTMNFPGVLLPANTTFAIVIQNIRIATSPVATFAQTQQVIEGVSTSPFLVNISNPNPVVATVNPALIFKVTDCAGGDVPNMNFQQCISEPRNANALTFGVQFTEAIVGTFKSNNDTYGLNESDKPIKMLFSADQFEYFVDESIADTATRLIVRWTELPTGVTLKVTNKNIDVSSRPAPNNTAFIADQYAVACYVNDASINGLGGDPMDCSEPSPAITCKSVAKPVNLVNAEASGSTVYAVWELDKEDQNRLDTLTFGVQVTYSSATVGLTAAGSNPTTTGALAPISTVGQATRTDNIPRFIDLALASNSPIVIAPCRTNLLFPYLTNLPEADYDSGVALVNTSTDPFGTRTQHGACTTYWYGNIDIAPQTTEDFGPGGVAKQDGRDVLMKKFALSSPLSEFTESTAGFEGYMIARCNFQYAHGFAFVVSLTEGFGSEAYLALIIPDTGAGTRLADPFSAAGSGTGEQLVH
jgi:hypothetical protein